MRYLKILALLFVLLLPACTVSTGQPPAAPANLETAPPLPPQAPRPSQQNLAQQLGVPEDAIEILNLQAARFAQACFEPVAQELNCAEGEIVGYTVALQYKDRVYLYRESADGRYVHQYAQATVPQYIGDQARFALAQQLKADPGQITVENVDATRFPNSCLGLSGLAQTCTPGETNGYTVTLAYNGKSYGFRSNITGSLIAPVK